MLATHTLGSRFLEAPQITKKALLQYIPGWREPGAARKDGENIRGTCCALGCVGGSLAEAQRGTEIPREAERGPESLREAQAKRWPVFVPLWPRLTYTYIHTYIHT